MKKNLILTLMVLCVGFGPVSAQLTSNTITHDKGFVFNAGIKLGATFTSLEGKLNEGDFYDKAGTGIQGGIFIGARFGKRRPEIKNSLSGTGLFGIQAEAIYRTISAKTLGNDDLKMNYFEVPVLLQFYPFYKSKNINNIYFEAGLSVAGTMGSNPDVIIVDGARSYAVGDLKGFDMRPAVGVGWFHAASGIGLNMRYNFGMSKLAKNFPLKTNIFECNLTFRLPYSVLPIGNNLK